MEEQKVVVADSESDAKSSSNLVEKSFLERVLELVGTLQSAKGYDSHEGLKRFKSIVEKTMKRNARQKAIFEDVIRSVFVEFYEKNAEQIKSGSLEFLTESKSVLICGESGETNIPLSEVYAFCEKSNPNLLVNIEANVFFIMSHVCPKDDLEEILDICSEFEEDEPKLNFGSSNFMSKIGNIIGKVTSKLNNQGGSSFQDDSGQINTNAVGGIIGELMNDGDIQRDMGDMLSTITGNKDTNVNDIIQGLMGNAASGNSNN